MIPQLITIEGDMMSPYSENKYKYEFPEEYNRINKNLSVYGTSVDELAPLMGSKFGDWWKDVTSSVTGFFEGQRNKEAENQANQEFLLWKQQQEKGVFDNPMVLGAIILGAILLLKK